MYIKHLIFFIIFYTNVMACAPQSDQKLFNQNDSSKVNSDSVVYTLQPTFQDEHHIILNQPNSPIQILSVKSEFFDPENILRQFSDFEVRSLARDFLEASGKDRRGIYFDLSYKNISNQPIIAIQFGLLSFDVFNELIDSMGGVTLEEIEPNEEKKGLWRMNDLHDFMHWTAIVYIQKVRFKYPDSNNVVIWSYDKNNIIQQISNIIDGFKASMLEEEEEE